MGVGGGVTVGDQLFSLAHTVLNTDWETLTYSLNNSFPEGSYVIHAANLTDIVKLVRRSSRD